MGINDKLLVILIYILGAILMEFFLRSDYKMYKETGSKLNYGCYIAQLILSIIYCVCFAIIYKYYLNK